MVHSEERKRSYEHMHSALLHIFIQRRILFLLQPLLSPGQIGVLSLHQHLHCRLPTTLTSVVMLDCYCNSSRDQPDPRDQLDHRDQLDPGDQPDPMDVMDSRDQLDSMDVMDSRDQLGLLV